MVDRPTLSLTRKTGFMFVGSATSIVLLCVAGVFALADWWAVASRHQAAEYVAKPAMTAACLLAAAVSPAQASAQRGWWIAAFAFCLAGDVFLMFDRWKEASYFVFGLGSFFLGHVFFVAGFAARGWDTSRVIVSAIAVGILGGALLIALARGAIARGQRDMVVPLCAYVSVITVMMSGAIGAGPVIAIVGAGLFMLSDSMIGISRFLKPFPGHDLAVIVTYHLALIGLVLALR